MTSQSRPAGPRICPSCDRYVLVDGAVLAEHATLPPRPVRCPGSGSDARAAQLVSIGAS